MNLLKKFIVICIGLSIIACGDEVLQQKVTFEGEFPEYKWAIEELNPELPSDWSSYNYLSFDMEASSTQRFHLNIFGDEGIRKLVIHPFQGAKVRASIPLIHFQKRNTEGMDMAAISKTPRPGYWIGFTSQVGPITQIDSMGVAMRLPIGSPELVLSNLSLTSTPQDTVYGPIPLVDEFGQWIPGDWQGKANSIDDLKGSWVAEDQSLEPLDYNVSQYGGFLDAKASSGGSGYFRVEKIDGKWWFVDPDGYLFYSTGSCVVLSGASIARASGREYIYSALPPTEDVTPAQFEIRREHENSIYTWNLNRRYGSDWYQKWMDKTVQRMESWGINTIGNWSDPNLGAMQKKAYVSTLRGWGIETGIMGMPDVYHPGYEAKVDSAAEAQCAPLKKDPYLLGYFVGNEPPWPGREQDLAQEILSGENTPMKAALKEFLLDGDSPERRKEFVYNTFSKFLTIVNGAIKKYDPNHLNLGLRYGGNPPDDIIKASQGFDVFSINIYGYDTKAKLKRVYDLTGLPIVIGEFHFGTPGRGLAPGLAQTKNHHERATAYRYYVENAAAHPGLIGTHWFQWIDQPSSGRFDGENYNIGFLDVGDRPYPEMIDASREIFKRLLDVHSGKVLPVSREAIRQ